MVLDELEIRSIIGVHREPDFITKEAMQNKLNNSEVVSIVGAWK
jgi:hypothetical protein